MYNAKFVQKLAFAYRNCPLSLETTKHFLAYIYFVLYCLRIWWINLQVYTATNVIE